MASMEPERMLQKETFTEMQDRLSKQQYILDRKKGIWASYAQIALGTIGLACLGLVFVAFIRLVVFVCFGV